MGGNQVCRCGHKGFRHHAGICDVCRCRKFLLRPSVRDWPSYLLRGIPPDLFQLWIDEAVRKDWSLNDVARHALCQRYRLECDPESTMHVAGRYAGRDTILLRLQPELYKEIKRETGNEYGALRALILTTLTEHLEGAE